METRFQSCAFLRALLILFVIIQWISLLFEIWKEGTGEKEKAKEQVKVPLH